MGSPTLTVSVLIVLWLIVIVPMIFRRRDAGAQERSVQRFGQAMRSLTRRTTVFATSAPGQPLARAADPEDASYVRPRVSAARDEMFVTGTAPAASRTQNLAVRRPVPPAQEALMYPVERSEMSAARQQMMARRRRSLSILGGGSVVMLLLAMVVGGGLFWTAAVLFILGLAGYVWFLRSQALRDRERRENRQERHSVGRMRSYDVTEREEFFAEPPASVVRIDDDDIALHNLDTIDLTGLYSEEMDEPAVAQRRAS
jgi:hypothetical protein